MVNNMEPKRILRIEDLVSTQAREYGIANTLYGALIITKSKSGAFRMLDEPNYMDWQDRLEYSKQYRSDGKIYFQRRIR